MRRSQLVPLVLACAVALYFIEYSPGQAGELGLGDVSARIEPFARFADSQEYATSLLGVRPGPRGIRVGDVDLDGDLDVVTVNSNNSGLGHSVAILINDGTGQLAMPMIMSAAPRIYEPRTYDLRLADFDGNGYPDIAVANGNNNGLGISLGVFFNQGGSFAEPAHYATAFDPYPWGYEPFAVSLATGDVDRDGDVDIVVGNGKNCGLDRSVAVMLNDGQGDFDLSARYSTAADWYEPMTYDVELADLNGDEWLDLAVANRNNSDQGVSLGVLLNQGGTFADVVNYPTAPDPSGQGYEPGTMALVTGDLDGDGDIDIVVANGNNDSLDRSVGVLLNDGAGGFGSLANYPATKGINEPVSGDIALGDFNHDGRLDIAVANLNQDGNFEVGFSVLINKGNTTFGHPMTFATTDIPADVGDLQSQRVWPHALDVGDMNGDGVLDVVTAHYYSQTVGVILGED